MKPIKFNIAKLRIEISNDLYQKLSLLQNKSCDKEKGGVLMGSLYPSINQINITHILESKMHVSSSHNINLNVKYLQKKMNDIWEKSHGKITYLGDWHSHPENKPNPSIIDYYTFIKNFYMSQFDHNILIYLILGNKSIWSSSFNGSLFHKFTLIINQKTHPLNMEDK